LLGTLSLPKGLSKGRWAFSSSLLLVQELPSDMDHQFRFLRIACPEFQETLVIVAYVRDAREGDPVVLSFGDFFYIEFHLLVERVVHWLELQRLAELPFDVDGFNDRFLSGSLQENHFVGYHDRRFDQSINNKDLLRGLRVVRVHSGSLSDLALVSCGIEL